MKLATLLSAASLLLASAAPATANPIGTIVSGRAGVLINRGQDQVPPNPGVRLEAGDVVKCLGRTTLKAFVGDALVVFGPLSVTRIVSAAPLTLELEKGSLRVMTDPAKAAVPFRIQTAASMAGTDTRADIYMRYNASSEFTEIALIDGTAGAANRKGMQASVDLKARESTLLSPDSPPTQPSLMTAQDIGAYTRDLDSVDAPYPNGDVYAALEPIVKRVSASYEQLRRSFARPSLPANAPFRTYDTQRPFQTTLGFDQPGFSVAPGDADVTLQWRLEREPRLTRDE